MQGLRRAFIFSVFAFIGFRVVAEEAESAPEVIISVAEQKLMVIRDGMWTHKFRVSTSKFGVGDSYGSYKTPVGKLRVCDKIGAGFAAGSVIKHRSATGEVLPVNAPGRDPIVTRILWLEGLEAGNEHAKARGIYIHGTVEESKIGEPVSYGCIRMKSREVIELFDVIPVGTLVSIEPGRLPHLRRWTAPPASVIATAKPNGTAEPKIEPKAEPKSEPKPVAEKADAGAPHMLSGDGHNVLSQRAAAELHRRHWSSPQASSSTFSNASEAMKGSILFADLPHPEPKAKAAGSQ